MFRLRKHTGTTRLGGYPQASPRPQTGQRSRSGFRTRRNNCARIRLLVLFSSCLTYLPLHSASCSFHTLVDPPHSCLLHSADSPRSYLTAPTPPRRASSPPVLDLRCVPDGSCLTYLPLHSASRSCLTLAYPRSHSYLLHSANYSECSGTDLE